MRALTSTITDRPYTASFGVSPYVKLKSRVMKLIDFLKERGATNVSKVNGPNGAFLSVTNADGTTSSMPIGNKSKDGKLAEYQVLATQDKVTGETIHIATVNSYETVESLAL